MHEYDDSFDAAGKLYTGPQQPPMTFTDSPDTSDLFLRNIEIVAHAEFQAAPISPRFIHTEQETMPPPNVTVLTSTSSEIDQMPMHHGTDMGASKMDPEAVYGCLDSEIDTILHKRKVGK